MSEPEPQETVTIRSPDPLARILHKQAWRCRDCGGAIFHCALADSGEHVNVCISVIQRRPN